MTTYTLQDLNREARLAAKEIKRETGYPAKVKYWQLILDGQNATLAVIVLAYDGLRQRNVAI